MRQASSFTSQQRLNGVPARSETGDRRMMQGEKRSAFTLVELVVVILVIGILMAFLFPAINQVITNSRVAQVTAEIKSLDSALAAFKSKYGISPPSRLRLYEEAAGWVNDTSLQARESKAYLRQIWPEMDFTYAAAPTPGELDIDGDGTIRAESDGPIVLTGAECLVFFLGGVCATEDSAGNPIRNADGSLGTAAAPAKWAPLGFSTDQTFPFRRGGSRVAPFHEFDSARLVNVNDPTSQPGRNMPEYLDSLPGQVSPYIYASSYDGRGYNKDTMTNVYLDIDLGAPSFASPTSIYLSSDPDGSVNTDVSNDVPYQANSYQIISPGFDNSYGVGGLYDPDTGFDANRGDEKDNITNFSSGVLDSN
ncbi:hypothetical protein KOR42_18460 [Thalassoglobus neptunius]|uniref:Type II secretion system protein G n=2 Tax=Thalassoglobus neptunius TaxID=1938619 RepID=A0A5C5X813_9PLAN|nr:hypothetical protein KOR42_18460 [Thalassoglobus neptunius]